MSPSWFIPLGIIGLIISSYIFSKKTGDKKLVCLIGEDCDRVVKSKYGYVLGIPNELFGIFYYLGIIAVGMFPLFALTSLLPAVAALALLASLYLLSIQAFILHEWCEYCIASAVVNFFIFLLVI